MAVNPLRASVRRFATSAARAASSAHSVTPQEMTGYHEQVSKAQGVVDTLIGGRDTISSPSFLLSDLTVL